MVRIKNPITVVGGGGDDGYAEMLGLLAGRYSLTEFNDTKGVVKSANLYAFAYCSNLSYVNLPECSVINNYCFMACRNLETVNLPECKTLGYIVFDTCIKLSNLSVPNVSIIYSGAFQNCYSLSTLSLPGVSFIGGSSYSSNIFLNTSTLKEIYLPNCRYIIASNWFNQGNSTIRGLKNVQFTDKLTYLTSTFYRCQDLETVNLGDRCYSLTSTFVDCAALKNIYCDYIYSISASVFTSCPNLSSIKFLNLMSVSTRMYYYVLTSCSKLESVYLYMNSVLTKPNYIFNNTPITVSTLLGYYGSIYVPSTVYNSYITATGWSSLSERFVSVNVEDIPDLYAGKYLNNTELTNIPSQYENNKIIPYNCFQGCTNLTSANLPECLYIYQYGFQGCTSLTSINLPECANVGAYAFSGCISLSEIDLPKCGSIGTSGFAGNTNLLTVNLASETSENGTTINSYGFYRCYNLSQINGKIRYVGNSCFIQCRNLTSINLTGCSYIGSDAFLLCSKLESIYLLDSTIFCSLGFETAFFDTPISSSTYLGRWGSIFVPASLVDTYKTASRWSAYSNRITAYIEP